MNTIIVGKNMSVTEELHMAKGMVEALTSNATVAFIVCNLNHVVLHVNHTFEQVFRWESEDVIGTVLPIIPSEKKVEYECFIKGNNYEISSYETIRQRCDGKTFTVSEAVAPVKNELGDVIAYALIVKDITERKLAGRRLLESEQRFKSLFEYNPSSVFLMTIEGRLTNVNKATEIDTGYTSKELADILFEDVVVEQDKQLAKDLLVNARLGTTDRVELSIIHKSGVIADFLVISFPMVIDGKVDGIYAIAENITEKKQAEKMINYMAFHDVLTELPNRRLFQERAEHFLKDLMESKYKLGVVIIDLDQFKMINDTLGHSVGDKVLKEVSSKLLLSVRKKDVVSRMGGDEFTILLPEILHLTEIEQVAKRIINSFLQPIQIDGHEVKVTPSIGIAISPDNGTEIDSLLNYSDKALYKVKKTGKNNYLFFHDQI